MPFQIHSSSVELHKKTPSLWHFYRKYQETEHSLPYSISIKTCTPALFYLEVKNTFSCVTVSSAKISRTSFPDLPTMWILQIALILLCLLLTWSSHLKLLWTCFWDYLDGKGNVMFLVVCFFHLGSWVHERTSGAQCLCFSALLNEGYSWWLSALDPTDKVSSPCSVLTN